MFFRCIGYYSMFLDWKSAHLPSLSHSCSTLSLISGSMHTYLYSLFLRSHSYFVLTSISCDLITNIQARQTELITCISFQALLCAYKLIYGAQRYILRKSKTLQKAQTLITADVHEKRGFWMKVINQRVVKMLENLVRNKHGLEYCLKN